MLSYKDIAKIFEEIEIRLIGSLKRNLTRHKNEEKQYNINWSAWQAEKLRNLDKFRQENSFIMSDYTKVIDSGTHQIMLDEFAQGMNGINYPSDSEISKEPQFFGIDKIKVNKLIDDVVNLEKHAETAVLRTMDDIYRQTVNKAQLAMSSGSVTLQQAIDMAVQDFLNKGINCIVYRNGRRVNIADYVRMALRTTATRANLQGQSEKIKALGYDTILISSYSMCSETCLPWQGRVYINDVFVMWEGKIEQRGEILYGKSNYCGKWFPLLSSAIQGGLFHPNCRHTLLMWRDGDPIPQTVDNSKNNRRYKLEQHQRLLENNVRKAKRFVAGQTDPSNIRKAKAELINAQKRLREFIQQTNISENETVLKRDYGREKVYQNENLQNGLTFNANDDKIITASNAHPRNIELENNIKRCIDSELPIFADDLVRGVSKIKPPNNEYVVGLHGCDTATWIFGTKIDVKILSNIIKARRDYHGEDIYLFSCNTGNTSKTKDCFAQLLADKLGVTVYAPTEYGVVWSNGKHYSGKLDFTPSGEIKPFKPRK